MAERPEPFQDLNWPPERARAFGEGVLDLWTELLRELPELPVTRKLTEQEVRDAVTRPVPDEPLTQDEILEHIRSVFFHYSMYPGHPRFMAYVTGAGTAPGAVADLAASALNPNVGRWLMSPAATEIELHVTRWFADQFGLPDTAGGLFVTGGAMANFVALKVARDAKAGWDTRAEGVASGPQLVAYASEEVHAVLDRAVDMLGLGTNALRKIPVDESYRVDLEALEESILEDLAAGAKPFAVVATAGTVATGAIDPLPEAAAICERYDLWFHVDASYGGPAVLAEEFRPLFRGLEDAHSIAFDPHKWLAIPQPAGCILVHDLQHLSDSFAVKPTYVHQDKRRTRHGLDLGMLGPQFSRSFLAFKVWISLLAYGRRAYARRIAHDVALAEYLAEVAEERVDFEVVTPPSLSICCFRYVPPDLPQSVIREEYLSMLNERVLLEVQQDGRAFCSNAVLDGRFVLRACIINYRTEAADIDLLMEVAAELGERLDKELRPMALRYG
jgi:aromatic-L-amino-acid decarboxylase